MKKWLVLGILVFTLHYSQAQIRGKVYDSESNLPLGRVEITQKGKLIGTTNVNGMFILPSSITPDTVLFSRLGYQTQSLVLSETDSLLMINMKTQSIELGDVVVRAYNTNKAAFNATGALSMLSSRQIHKSSDNSPAPLLNSVSGMYMHSGARNTNRITMRGIGSRSMYTTTKVKAYLNAIPLTSGIGETTLEDLDLDLIDRITVMKGPSSTIYGAPLGGTILYRMGTPSTLGTSVRQELTVGSFNMLKNSTQLNWKDKHTAVKLAYNKLNDNGFRENDDYRRDAFTALLKHQLTEDIGITYLGRYHALKAYIPSSISQEVFQNAPEQAAENWKSVRGHEKYSKILNGLTFNVDISEDIRNETSLFLKNYNGDEVRPFNVLDDQTLTTGGRTLFEWNGRWNKWKLTSEAGYEYFRESYDWKIYETLNKGIRGERLNNNAQTRLQQNTFAAIDGQLNNLGVSAGLNLNNTGYRYNDLLNDSIDYSDKKNYRWIISPRFSITYRFTDQLMAFATISHGFSAPSYEETLNAQGFVNGSIEPETGWNRELGLRGRYWNNRLFFKTSAYSIAVENLLVTKRLAEDEFYKINAGKTFHNGLEAMTRLNWWQGSLFSSSVNLSYTFADYSFQDFKDAGNDYSGNHLPGIPKHKINLQLSADLPYAMYLQTNWLVITEMPMNDANNLYSDGYSRLNAKAGVNYSLDNNWHLDIYSGIKNLTDNHYASMILINAPSYGGQPPRYYYPAEPRNYFAGISIRYAFQ